MPASSAMSRTVVWEYPSVANNLAAISSSWMRRPDEALREEVGHQAEVEQLGVRGPVVVVLVLHPRVGDGFDPDPISRGPEGADVEDPRMGVSLKIVTGRVKRIPPKTRPGRNVPWAGLEPARAVRLRSF